MKLRMYDPRRGDNWRFSLGQGGKRGTFDISEQNAIALSCEDRHSPVTGQDLETLATLLFEAYSFQTCILRIHMVGALARIRPSLPPYWRWDLLRFDRRLVVYRVHKAGHSLLAPFYDLLHHHGEQWALLFRSGGEEALTNIVDGCTSLLAQLEICIANFGSLCEALILLDTETSCLFCLLPADERAGAVQSELFQRGVLAAT